MEGQAATTGSRPYTFNPLSVYFCYRARAANWALLIYDERNTLLAATFNGRRRALNTRELLRASFALPLVT